MNKQKLIAHFQEQKKIIEAEIAFWQAQPDDVPEKPKLKHGDFGIQENNPFVVMEQATLFGSPKAFFANQAGQIGANESIPYSLRHGNIFKMMEGWSEKFENIFIYNIRLEKSNVEDIYINASNVHLTKAEAYEIWLKFGHALA